MLEQIVRPTTSDVRDSVDLIEPISLHHCDCIGIVGFNVDDPARSTEPYADVPPDVVRRFTKPTGDRFFVVGRVEVPRLSDRVLARNRAFGTTVARATKVVSKPVELDDLHSSCGNTSGTLEQLIRIV